MTPEGPQPASPSLVRRHGWWVGLVLVFVALRVVLLLLTYAPDVDTVRYFALADQMASGDLAGGLRHPYHPLYPGLLALATSLVPWREGAGYGLALLLSVLTLLPLHGTAREAVGPQGARFCLVLFAVTPAPFRLSVAILSEPLFILLLACAAWAAARVLRRGSLGAAPLAGLAGGAAYLTRPEGLVPVMAMLVAAGLPLKRRPDGPGTARRLGCALVAAAACLAVSLPYMVHVGGLTGKKRMTRMARAAVTAPEPGFQRDAGPSSPAPAPGLTRFSTLGRDPSVEARQEPLSCPPGRVALAWLRAGHFVIAPLFLLGLWAAWRGLWPVERARAPALFFASWTAGLLVALTGLAVAYRYVSLRHMVPVTVLMMPHAAAGALALWRAARRARFAWALPALYGLCLLLAVFFVVQSLKPLRYNRRHLKPVGLWIGAREPAPHILLSTDPRYAFYSGGGYLHLGLCSYEEMVALARVHGATHLVDTEKRLRRTVPDFFAARDGRVVPVSTGLEEAYGGKPRPLVFRFTSEER